MTTAMLTILIISHVTGSVLAWNDFAARGKHVHLVIKLINAGFLAVYISLALWSPVLGWIITAMSVLGLYVLVRGLRATKRARIPA